MVKGSKKEEFQKLGIKTAKRGTAFVSGQIINALIILLVLIYLARALKPVAFGFYTIVIAYSLVLGMGGNFGIGTAFRKKIPEVIDKKQKIRSLISNGAFISVGIASIIAIIGIVASPYIARFIYHNVSIILPLRIAAGSIVLAVLFNALIAALLGMHKASEARVASITYASTQLVFVVILITLGYGILGALTAYALGLAMGSIVAFGYIVNNLGLKIARIENKIIKELTKFSLPVVTSNVAVLGIMNFAPMYLGIFASAAIVGNYGIALKGVRFIEVLIVSTTFVLLPAFSTVLSKKNIKRKIGSALNNSIYYTSLFIFPLIAYMIGNMRSLIDILFSKAYSIAPIYASIALIGLSVEITWSIASTLVVGYGNTKRYMQYQLFIVIIELGTLLVLTPIYKAFGTLLAVFIIAPIAAVILYTRLLKKEFKVHVSFNGQVRIAIASVVLALVLIVLTIAMHQSKYALIVNVVVLLLLYPMLLSLFNAINQKQFKFVSEFIQGRGRIGKIANLYLSYVLLFFRSRINKRI